MQNNSTVAKNIIIATPIKGNFPKVSTIKSLYSISKCHFEEMAKNIDELDATAFFENMGKIKTAFWAMQQFYLGKE